MIWFLQFLSIIHASRIISGNDIINRRIWKKEKMISLISKPELAIEYSLTPQAAAYACSWALYVNKGECIPTILDAMEPKEIDDQFWNIALRFLYVNGSRHGKDKVSPPVIKFQRILKHSHLCIDHGLLSILPSEILVEIIGMLDYLDIISLLSVSWFCYDFCVMKVGSFYQFDKEKDWFRLSAYKVYEMWLAKQRSPRFISLLRSSTQLDLMWDFIRKHENLALSFNKFAQHYSPPKSFLSHLLPFIDNDDKNDISFVEWIKMFKGVLCLDTAKIVAEKLKRLNKLHVPTDLLVFMLTNNYTKRWIDYFLGHLEKLTLSSLKRLIESTVDNGYLMQLVKRALNDDLRDSVMAHYILSYANTPAKLLDVLNFVPDRHEIEVKPEHIELLCNFDEDFCILFLEKFPNCKISSALFNKLQMKFGDFFTARLVTRLDMIAHYTPTALLKLPDNMSEDMYLVFLSRCISPLYETLNQAIRRKYTPLTIKLIVRNLVYLKVNEYEREHTLSIAKEFDYDEAIINYIKENIRIFSR